MQGVEVATRFSSILSVWNREDKHREPGPNPASPHKLQLFIPRFHAILYRVHGMEPGHFAGGNRCAYRGCALVLIPWSYGRGIIYRADWNSISASSCIRKAQDYDEPSVESYLYCYYDCDVDRTPGLSFHLPACRMEQWVRPTPEPSFLASQSLLSRPV